MHKYLHAFFCFNNKRSAATDNQISFYLTRWHDTTVPQVVRGGNASSRNDRRNAEPQGRLSTTLIRCGCCGLFMKIRFYRLIKNRIRRVLVFYDTTFLQRFLDIHQSLITRTSEKKIHTFLRLNERAIDQDFEVRK